MSYTISICGPRDRAPKGAFVVNTTSRSKEEWSKGLSPFFLGPIKMYGCFVSCNMENAYQFGKIYKQHIDVNGEPSLDYWLWAVDGWSNPRAIRYPMGKGAVPEYSYWDGKKLTYVDARKQIYVPLYSQAVKQTQAFEHLTELHNQQNLWLWDFDGYDYQKAGMTLKEVLNCPTRKMGHCFVLLMLLTNLLSPEGFFLE